VQQKHVAGPRSDSNRLSCDASGAFSAGSWFSSMPYFWPLLAGAAASSAAASCLSEFAFMLAGSGAKRQAICEPRWATPNRVALELQSLQLRDFSRQIRGAPTLVCAPFALHGATIVDFAPGHSLVEALSGSGLDRIYVTDWRSATPEMRFLSIDNYLADLNVAVDQLGPPVDLIGPCQGGWLAVVYAARFPGKVRRLVLAGAPIDIDAGESALSRLAKNTPVRVFEELVRLGEGRILGHHVLELWAPALAADEADRVLQIPSDVAPAQVSELEERFRTWYAWTVDLPGTYYLQVVRWLFRDNQIVDGRFVALGRAIDLAEVRMPVFLLAARDDELVSPIQLMATMRVIGTPKAAVETIIQPCGHLSLFLGAETLGGTWPRIARWLSVGRESTKSEAA
jgi:poly(3-hydroxyalkanoate) synthetase